jgi:hypothetical protein
MTFPNRHLSFGEHRGRRATGWDYQPVLACGSWEDLKRIGIGRSVITVSNRITEDALV